MLGVLERLGEVLVALRGSFKPINDDAIYEVHINRTRTAHIAWHVDDHYEFGSDDTTNLPNLRAPGHGIYKFNIYTNYKLKQNHQGLCRCTLGVHSTTSGQIRRYFSTSRNKYP